MKRTASELAKFFKEKQYKWRINDRLKVPSEADMLDTLEGIRSRLENEPVGTWLETGRLIVLKEDKTYDVYVLHAQLEQESTDEQPTTDPVL